MVAVYYVVINRRRPDAEGGEKMRVKNLASAIKNLEGTIQAIASAHGQLDQEQERVRAYLFHALSLASEAMEYLRETSAMSNS